MVIVNKLKKSNFKRKLFSTFESNLLMKIVYINQDDITNRIIKSFQTIHKKNVYCLVNLLKTSTIIYEFKLLLSVVYLRMPKKLAHLYRQESKLTIIENHIISAYD